MADSANTSLNPFKDSGFATTHWSVVMAAGKGHSAQAADALEQLCRTYWYPLYAFVRRHVSEAHDAEDLTQEFFTRFLAKEYFGRADPVTPEQVYDRRWALTLLETVLARLAEEQSIAGKERIFAPLKGYLWGEAHGTSYAEMAECLGMTEGAVKVAVHQLRRRLRDLLREEVAHTVATDAEIDEELRHPIEVIRG